MNHVEIWRVVLTDWLGWSDERFEMFVRWNGKVGAFDSPMGALHDSPLVALIPLVVPDALMASVGAQVGWDFVEAAGPRLGYDDCDWDGARMRVAALFAQYGHVIPDASYVSACERRTGKA